MAENELVVEVREATGKGAARRLRQAGRIPGVCYGRNATPVSVSLDPKGLEHVLKTSSSGAELTTVDATPERPDAEEKVPRGVS